MWLGGHGSDPSKEVGKPTRRDSLIRTWAARLAKTFVRFPLGANPVRPGGVSQGVWPGIDTLGALTTIHVSPVMHILERTNEKANTVSVPDDPFEASRLEKLRAI